MSINANFDDRGMLPHARPRSGCAKCRSVGDEDLKKLATKQCAS
jgi:hypothetical protein